MALRSQLQEFLASCELLLANLETADRNNKIQIYKLNGIELTKKQHEKIVKYEKAKKSNLEMFRKNFKVSFKQSSLSEQYKVLKWSKEEILSEIQMLKYELGKNKKIVTDLKKIQREENKFSKQLIEINSQISHQEKSLLRRLSISEEMKEKLRELDHKQFQFETQIIKMETNAITQRQTLENRKKWQILDEKKQSLLKQIAHLNSSHSKAQQQITVSLMNKNSQIREINETVGQIYLQLKEQRQIIDMIMRKEGISILKPGKDKNDISDEESVKNEWINHSKLRKSIFRSQRKSQTEGTEEIPPFPLSHKIEFKIPQEIKKKNRELKEKRKTEEVKSLERYKKKNLTEIKRHKNSYPSRYSHQLPSQNLIFQNLTLKKRQKTRYSFESSSPKSFGSNEDKPRSSIVNIYENMIEKNKKQEEEDWQGLKFIQKNKKRFKRYKLRERKIMENRESDEERF